MKFKFLTLSLLVAASGLINVRAMESLSQDSGAGPSQPQILPLSASGVRVTTETKTSEETAIVRFHLECEDSESEDIGLIHASLDDRALSPIGNDIKKIRISNYSNVKMIIKPGAFKRFKNLRELWLDGCNITFIEPGAFVGLDSLSELWLDGNHLKTIEKDTFKGLGKLHKLHLDWSNITFIEPGAFEGLDSLSELLLDGNHLETIEKDTFQGLGKLHKLDLDSCDITCIRSNAFVGLNSLRELLLDGNKLGEIHDRAFEGLNDTTIQLLNLICRRKDCLK